MSSNDDLMSGITKRFRGIRSSTATTSSTYMKRIAERGTSREAPMVITPAAVVRLLKRTISARRRKHD